MPNDLNRFMVIGRLIRDPEIRYTANGTSVTNFSIANNRSYTQGGNKKEETSFFNCTAWSKLGELITQYCQKGSKVAIEGRLQQRSWDAQDGSKRTAIEVVVENVQFLSQNPERGSAGSYVPFPEESPFSDDDIPF